MKVALDIDDVLAAFTLHAHNFYNLPMEKCDYWCAKTMAGKFGDNWFMKDIAPHRKFWETIPVLSHPDEIDFEFHYYISALPFEMYGSRLNWLRRCGFPNKPLIIASDKLTKCLELGVNILVDDKPETIKNLLGSPVKGIHFVNHYAGFDPVGEYVIKNLKQVKQYL